MSERPGSGDKAGAQETEPSRENTVSLSIDRHQLELVADVLTTLINERYFLNRAASLDKGDKAQQEANESQWQAASGFLDLVEQSKNT